MVTHRTIRPRTSGSTASPRSPRSTALPTITPDDPNAPDVVEQIRALQPDFLFSFYYRHMLKRRCSRCAPRGALNMHGSLLPKYRGRVPVNWAVINGETETGATLHYMTEKPDAGDIVDQQAVPILPDDTAHDVFGKVTDAAAIVLDRSLPALIAGTAPRKQQNLAAGSYFGGRKPEDGRIDWRQSRRADPQPGARRRAALSRRIHHASPARRCEILRTKRMPSATRSRAPALYVEDGACLRRVRRTVRACNSSTWNIDGAPFTAAQFLARFGDKPIAIETDMKKILILGVNGFIGHHLSQRIIKTTDWEVYGMDMQTERVSDLLKHPRFHFFEGDITINKEWIEYHIRKCDTVLPLVAIATPATYVKEPLRVFELDFEANLPIVRSCVKYKKRILFPSTSEVYGMCRDGEFDPDSSELVLGPIDKQRWIYSCSKQLMDRVIWAYGSEGKLDFTLFRPFNWIGAGLDSIHTPKEGSSRVITQFLGHIVRGENIKLVDGGTQKRAFTYISDGIDALMKIIDNPRGIASGKIYNIGNPKNNYSVKDLAQMMLELALTYPEYRGSAKKVQTGQDHLGRVLRQRLSGRAEPRAENHQYLQRPQVAAARRHAGRAQAYLRRLSQPRRAMRGIWWTDCADEARAQNRRRHLSRHARRRAAAGRDAAGATAPARRFCSASAPTTPGARSSACSARAS